MKAIKQVLRQDRESYRVPRRVQDVIPIRRIWSDGIFLVGNRFAKTFKFTDINYMVASQESQKNLFLTYAAPAVRNAMIDYIRSQNVSFEAKNLNSIISLDELAKDEVRSKHHFIADPTRQTPEQVYLAQERINDIHHALYMIEDREEQYLRYRFGFDDDMEHPLTETAKHFHLSESRAKKTEALALDNVWLELPWWY